VKDSAPFRALHDGARMDDVSVAERHDLERVYREQGRRLWWAVLAYSGDREIASDAVAEAFAQALRASGGVREPAKWVWRVAFRLAAAEMKARRTGQGRPVEASYEMDHRAREVLAALAQLSARQRSAIA